MARNYIVKTNNRRDTRTFVKASSAMSYARRMTKTGVAAMIGGRHTGKMYKVYPTYN